MVQRGGSLKRGSRWKPPLQWDGYGSVYGEPTYDLIVGNIKGARGPNDPKPRCEELKNEPHRELPAAAARTQFQEKPVERSRMPDSDKNSARASFEAKEPCERREVAVPETPRIEVQSAEVCTNSATFDASLENENKAPSKETPKINRDEKELQMTSEPAQRCEEVDKVRSPQQLTPRFTRKKKKKNKQRRKRKTVSRS